MGFFSQQDPTKGLDVLSENIKSLGTAAVRNPYQAGIGAVGGLVKGTILDPIAYGVGVPLTGISYAMGKKDFKPLNNYEEGVRNTVYNVAGVGNDAEKKLAASAGQTLGEVIGPGLATKIPGVGKFLAVSGPGAVGSTVGLAKEAQGQLLDKLATSPLVGNVLEGGVGALSKVGEGIDKIPGVQSLKKGYGTKAGAELEATINPQTLTTKVEQYDPGKLKDLASRYDSIPTSVHDIGEGMYNKYGDLTPKQLKSKVVEDLDALQFSPESKELLKKELVSSYNLTKKTSDYTAANDMFNQNLNKFLEEKSANGFVSPELEQSVLRNANSLVATKITDLNKAVVTNDFKAISSAKENIAGEMTNVLNKLKENDPELATAFINQVDKKPLGTAIGSLGMWLASETPAQDLRQLISSAGDVSRKFATRFGKDINEVNQNYDYLRTQKWAHANDALLSEIIDPSLSFRDAANEVLALEKGQELSRVLPKQVKEALSGVPDLQGKFKVLGELADAALYGYQQNSRAMGIQNLVLPKVDALVHSLGFVPGTAEFNQAFKNTLKEYLKETGFLQEKSSIAYKEGSAIGSTMGFDDSLQEFTKKNPAGSMMSIYTGWIQGAKRADLQTANNLKQVFNNYQKTKTLTNNDKAILLNGIVDLAESVALFGLRGVRLPFISSEIPGGQMFNMNPADSFLMGISRHITNWLDVDKETQDKLMEGLYGKIVAPTSARLNTNPVAGILQVGSGIGETIISKKFQTIADGIIKGLKTGDVSLTLGSILDSVVRPEMKNKALSASRDGKIFDNQGKNITSEFPTDTYAGSGIGGSQFVGNFKVQPTTGILNQSDIDLNTIGGVEQAIKDKYEFMTPEELLDNDETFDKFIRDLKQIQDPKRQDAVANSILKSLENPWTTREYKRIHSLAGKLIGLPKENVRAAFSSKSRNELVDVLGQAAALNDKKVVELYMYADLLPESQAEADKFLDDVLEKAQYYEKTKPIVKYVEDEEPEAKPESDLNTPEE